MDNDVKAAAQIQAEESFESFMLWTKRGTIWAVIGLMVVVFGCNSGVETGANKTGSGYNGEQYSPMNLMSKIKDKE